MTKIARNGWLSVGLFAVIVVYLINCSGTGSGQIPITTSSTKALEYFKLGRDLSERLRNPEAMRYFQRAVKADPDFALAYLYLASVNPSPKGFFENLELAHEFSDGISNGELLLIEATQAGVDGDPSRQLEIYNELVALYPNDLRARMLLANQEFARQNYEQAVAQYEAVVKMDVAYAPPYNMLGYAQRSLGNFKKAAEAFKRYIDLIPDDPNPYDSYAELLSRMGKFEEAIDYYRKALKADYTFGASRLGIASNLVFLDRHVEARQELAEYYDRAINIGQQRAALLGLAITCVDEGNYDQALEFLEQRYELDADVSDVAAMAGDLSSIGFVQILNQQPTLAEESFRRSIESIESSDIFERAKRVARQNSIAGQAQVELAKGNLSEAWNRANEYLGAVEPSANVVRIQAAHLLLGRVALAQRKFDTAIVHLEQANQEIAWSRFHLAAAYEGKGDTARAAELYESAATTYELSNLPHAAIRQEAMRRAEALKQ